MGERHGRPRISAEIERQILVEAGHRCAVCGESTPLQRAHIIPWRQSHEHRAEDLILLCANCHQRADHEGWGELVLRDYKQRPWILKHFDRPEEPQGTGLYLSSDILRGGAELNGESNEWGVHSLFWTWWLEFYVILDQRQPVTFPRHRLRSRIELAGLETYECEASSLETHYTIPPHVLGLLHTGRQRPSEIVLTHPMALLMVACGCTPPWPPDTPLPQAHLRMILRPAEPTYDPFEVVVALQPLHDATITTWRVEG